MKNKKKRKTHRRLILVCIVLGFIFIPQLAVDKVTEDKTSKTSEDVFKDLPIPQNDLSEVKTPVPNKAMKSSSSPSQQFANSSANAYDKRYTIDRNGLYELTGPVVDAANILSQSQYNQLDSFLRDLDDSTGVQIAVLTVPSLNGTAIEEFSIRHAEKWQLGQKGIDNGALLVAAMEEHALRIETGYGTEGALTDAKCARIIRNVLVPQFKSEKYGEGIIEAVETMAGIITEDDSLISKSMKTESSSDDTDDSTTPVELLFAILIIIVVLAFFFGGSGSSSGGSYRSSGYSGGHSYSSGRSYSGGGGHFGGGGASGHW